MSRIADGKQSFLAVRLTSAKGCLTVATHTSFMARQHHAQEAFFLPGCVLDEMYPSCLGVSKAASHTLMCHGPEGIARMSGKGVAFIADHQYCSAVRALSAEGGLSSVLCSRHANTASCRRLTVDGSYACGLMHL